VALVALVTMVLGHEAHDLGLNKYHKYAEVERIFKDFQRQ